MDLSCDMLNVTVGLEQLIYGERIVQSIHEIKLEVLCFIRLDVSRILCSAGAIARLSSKNMQEISSATNENTRKKGDRKIGDMFPETRKLLRDFYNSHNNKLGRLLGQQFNYNRDEQGMSF
ncbi:hypothetical protein MAR_030914 [Mya arenaria]|uniref:Uncharacterized protein n=1 Tax=Mya arenaria TaxID=6604 RepID=A0ABY7F2C7_MYAAR|nr:hypothetical protein MAR_030914 [Mya arenaria]